MSGSSWPKQVRRLPNEAVYTAARQHLGKGPVEQVTVIPQPRKLFSNPESARVPQYDLVDSHAPPTTRQRWPRKRRGCRRPLTSSAAGPGAGPDPLARPAPAAIDGAEPVASARRMGRPPAAALADAALGEGDEKEMLGLSPPRPRVREGLDGDQWTGQYAVSFSYFFHRLGVHSPPQHNGDLGREPLPGT